jgi:hypothetical protein
MKKVLTVMFALIIALVLSVNVFALNNHTFVSDSSVSVYGPVTDYLPLDDPGWGNPSDAVVTWPHPVWATWANWANLGPPATWISTSYKIGDDGGSVEDDSWRLFSKTVNLCEGAYNISGTITSKADNAEEVYLNGAWLYSDGKMQGPIDGPIEYKPDSTIAFIASPTDVLTFEFILRNYAGSSDPEANPTGIIFEASVDYDCPLTVEIDVKPGSFPSCFRNDGKGVIPVAIFGKAGFDVYDIDGETVELDGLSVVTKVKTNKLMAAYEDINYDGYMDYVVKVEDIEETFKPGMGTAKLTGILKDGTHIVGVGDICVRK